MGELNGGVAYFSKQLALKNGGPITDVAQTREDALSLLRAYAGTAEHYLGPAAGLGILKQACCFNEQSNL